MLDSIYFVNRLQSLQWLCSESDPNYPKALLFIPGADGRNNSGSVNLIKYLFQGSVGKSLFDSTLDEEYESLEDIVVLIKPSCVAVIYSEAMKKLVFPNLINVANLIEYTYSADELIDIDKFQMRKSINFKRMILELLSPGDGVGIAVPAGYDDIMVSLFFIL